jgi:hypothetical protein
MIVFLGVRGSIWIIFLFGNLSVLGAVIYWYREAIRKKYYMFRFPEKLLKVIIHYPSNQYKEFWRVIPEDAIFTLDGNTYEYSEPNVIKENEFYLRKEKDKEYISVEGKKYDFDEIAKIKKRKGFFPEIHYYYNAPKPIFFDYNHKKVDLTARQTTDFKVNDLFSKLLSLEGEKQLLIFIIILGIINALMTLYIILKIHGVFDKK